MSAIKYDSMFTDRISGNKNDQGLPLIDFSRDLNKTFWMDIKDENNVSSFFFRVKQFTPEDSTKITNAITSKKDVFFDANGNITIREPNSSDNIFQWLNLLSKNLYTASDYDNIFYRKDSNEQKRKINALPRPDFILSNNSTWILYTKDNICYILYNPLHRQSFKNYYNSTLKPTEYQDVSGKIDKLFNMYCGIQKKRNLTPNDIREYSDRSCNCIIQEDGIDDASGVKISNPQFRSEMKLAYFCYAPSCNSSSLEVSTSSFMDGTDGYRARRVKGEYGDSGCPARPVSICNIDITSAGNTNIVGSNLAQTCGFDSKTSQPAPSPPVTTTSPTRPSTTSPSIVTQPATTPVESKPDTSFTTSTDIKVVDIINKSYFINSDQVLIDNEDFKNNLIQNLLLQDKTLSKSDINIYITELDPTGLENIYKLDINLNKQIQMIESNVQSNIFTSDTVDNFSINKVKEFEDSDLPETPTKKPIVPFNLKLNLPLPLPLPLIAGAIILIIAIIAIIAVATSK